MNIAVHLSVANIYIKIDVNVNEIWFAKNNIEKLQECADLLKYVYGVSEDELESAAYRLTYAILYRMKKISNDALVELQNSVFRLE